MNVEQLRRNFEHCLARASSESDELQRMRYLRAAKSWKSLAEHKLRLDDDLVTDHGAAKPILGAAVTV
jgi:hypothetical protein